MRLFASLTAGLAAALLAGTALAQTFPTKPIKYIVPFPPGGASDGAARLAGQMLSDALGQPVVIENMAGAGAAIGTAFVAKAEPDGYTILHYTTGAAAINPHLTTVPYKLNDLVPVAMTVSAYGIMAVSAQSGLKSVKEVIDRAKAQPGKLNFGSAGNGTITHLWGEMFKKAAGVNMVHVPYRGSALAATDLISGQIELMFDSIPLLTPHVQSGRAVALAALGPVREKAFPNVPTLAEAGLPAFKGSSWFGVAAPAGTPPAIVKRLSDAIVAGLAKPENIAAFEKLGVAPSPMGHDAFVKQVADDYKAYGDLIREAGIKVN